MPTDYWNFQTDQLSTTTVAASAGVTNRLVQGFKTLLQARLTYDRELFTGHHITALAGMTEEYWFARNLSGNRTDRINPLLTELDATLPTFQTTGGNSSAEGLRSYIGRLNYTMYDKYLVEFNLRYDGSSKFLPGYQYGFFPSVGAGWRFSEEAFLSGLKSFLQSGKLRFSLGKLGNNSGVNRYEQRETLQLTNYILNGVVVKGFSANSLINPDFTWEETKATNFGLDLGFFDGRLTSTIDLYSRLTSGMIRPSQLSSLMSGYSAPRVNIGELQNRGVELTLGWQSKIGNFQYGANFNVSYNQNRLISWNEFLGKGYTFLDLPYHFVYTSEVYGIAQSWEDIQNAPYQNARFMSPGDVVYKDLNGDGQFNVEDRKASPVFNRDYFPVQGGLGLNASYKGFDINMLIQGSALRKDFWLEPLNEVNVPSSRNAFQSFHWSDTWNLDNRSASLPRIVTGSGGNNQAESQFWLDDHSYLRLKNLQIGYNLPSQALKRMGIDKFRVYFSSENIFTMSKFRGVDPEKSAAYDDPFPLISSYSFGINIDL
jgi:TonB-linked SusC/RagA family outer membrane protein